MVAKTRYSAAHSRTSGLEFTLYGAHMPSCFMLCCCWSGLRSLPCQRQQQHQATPPSRHHTTTITTTMQSVSIPVYFGDIETY